MEGKIDILTILIEGMVAKQDTFTGYMKKVEDQVHQMNQTVIEQDRALQSMNDELNKMKDGFKHIKQMEQNQDSVNKRMDDEVRALAEMMTLQINHAASQVNQMNQTVKEQDRALQSMNDEIKKMQNGLKQIEQMEQNQDHVNKRLNDELKAVAEMRTTAQRNHEASQARNQGEKHMQCQVGQQVPIDVQHSHKLEMLDMKINQLERKQRERNIRLVGYKESRAENCVTIIDDIIKDVLDIDGITVETAHRTGRKTGRPRHIIARVGTRSEKIEILKQQREGLKHKEYFIVDDLTQQDLQEKRRLQPIMQQASAEGKKWKFRNGRLIIEGRFHTEKENQEIETEMESAITRQMTERRESISYAQKSIGHHTGCEPSHATLREY